MSRTGSVQSPGPAPLTCSTNSSAQVETGRLIVAGRPEGPVKACVVCGTAKLALRINTATTTLAHFVAELVKRRLSVNEPTLLCGRCPLRPLPPSLPQPRPLRARR
jgi:hypothetical protein